MITIPTTDNKKRFAAQGKLSETDLSANGKIHEHPAKMPDARLTVRAQICLMHDQHRMSHVHDLFILLQDFHFFHRYDICRRFFMIPSKKRCRKEPAEGTGRDQIVSYEQVRKLLMKKSILSFFFFCLTICMLQTNACAAYPDAADWDALLKVPVEKAQNEANPEQRMAYNIYSDPDLSTTSGKFDGFLIDFKADKAGTATYWALCNWQMNLDDLMGKYDVTDTYAGAYAGLQMRPDGPKAIMSFWEINYQDESGNEKKIEAKRVYPPTEDTNRFDGEGEGTNYICDYNWKAETWYRMYLNCYQDTNGKTFVEQWVADLSTGEWTLISRFDTGLYFSCFEGTMSQFMENYDYLYANETRTFEYRNIRVRECGKEDWTTINTSRLSVDTFWDNKKGNAVFGATSDCFYGIANGYGPGQFEMDKDVGGTYTVEPTSDLDIPSTNRTKQADSDFD